MCGGLVTASCDKNNDIVRYQLGRLLGYMILGLFAGFLGSLVKIQNASPFITILPGISIGLLFLYWGFQNMRGKKAELPMPKFMGVFYTKLWKLFVYKNKGISKSFFTGLISIFLPCGLLYGVVLGGVALQHPFVAMLSMVFFWLGTVPSMVVAPGVFQKVLSPFKSKLPKTYAMSLIVIGVLTVSFRVVKFNELKQNATTQGSTQAPVHQCH